MLGLAGQQNWEDYTNGIAAEWMDLKINGTPSLPHWAKQWSHIDGIDQYVQDVSDSKSLSLLFKFKFYFLNKFYTYISLSSIFFHDFFILEIPRFAAFKNEQLMTTHCICRVLKISTMHLLIFLPKIFFYCQGSSESSLSFFDDSELISIVGIVLSLQGYGDNLKKFRNQVPQPERLLFSNEMLNRVIFSDSSKKVKFTLACKPSFLLLLDFLSLKGKLD